MQKERMSEKKCKKERMREREKKSEQEKRIWDK